jgi:hypothetical protein
MNISIQLTKTAPSSNAGKTLMRHDIDMDTALTISAALRAMPNVDVEATLVVENLTSAKRPSRRPQKLSLFANWLHHLRPVVALAR